MTLQTQRQQKKQLTRVVYLTMKRLIWLETDLEPDDVLATWILIRRGFLPSTIVVGEGRCATKAERMERYVGMLREEKLVPNDHKISIIQGQSSDKLFADDGKEFTPVAGGGAGDGSEDPRQYVKELTAYLASTDRPLLVALKPPRELALCLTLAKTDVSKCDLWLYGSFNLRCLLNSQKDADTKFGWIHKFQSTMLYESFHATGERNSIHDKVMPNLFARLRSLAKTSVYMATLFKLIGLWNRHILKECMEDCTRHAKSGAQDRLARSTKIVDSVKPFIDSQMVLADMALVAVAGESSTWKPVDVTWNAQGYSVLESNDKSPIHVCRNLDWDALEKALVNAV